MKLKIALFTLLTSISSISFAAEYKTLQTCVDNIEKDYPGQIMSMEVESANGVISYEFDIDTNVNGTDFFIEIECDAKTSQLSGFQLETHSEDPHFKTKAKVSVTEAEKAAIDKYSGVIVSREYGFASGKPFYSFDIYNQGKNMQAEITVDAENGAIIGVEEELYQIGPNRTF
ncbi:PepSY domain-containing protein [Methylophilaceae bacterium]|jgi:uncharacterized membrane protein YkoI|nr:PepSY domain-containing protein [Methylophilaceae bacterium]